MRILLIEDDPVIQKVLQRSLSDSGHRIDASDNFSDADQLWRNQPYDAVVLDLNLPMSHNAQFETANGLQLLQKARQRGDMTPVLILSARNRTEERIEGLHLGADDYLGKPFELAEVEARLYALTRRIQQKSEEIHQVGQLVLHRAQRRFSMCGDVLILPAREFEVLLELCSPSGRVVSKSMLSEKLSDLDDYLGNNALDVFISRIRKKIANSGATIRTVRGIGYILEVSPS
ncbi:MAG: response regulator transcription factor [Limnohabitans sp.]|nr:response regulator transcription factor [Limnohabitans sp.]